MVDTAEIFRRLSSGAKYDRRRVSRELAAIHGRSVDVVGESKSAAAALDFFGVGVEGDSGGEKVVASSGARKRKRQATTSLKRRRTEVTPEEGEEEEEEEEQDEEEVEGKEAEEEVDEGLELLEGRTLRRKRRKRKAGKETRAILQRQKANAFRNAHRIYVRGADIPDAVASFEELGNCYKLPPYLLKNTVAMGYTDPTPIQMQAIPLMLHGRELLACAPTGSGKTAAFLLPILSHLKGPQRVGFRAVVVSPTRELAQQTYRECLRLSAGSGFKVHVLTKAKASANSFGPESSQRFDILVTTPSRLVHMLACQPPAIQLSRVEWLVLDEADKLFEGGQDSTCFRAQVSQIISACDAPGVCHALFSATLGAGVEEFCHAHFNSPVRVIIGQANVATETVEQELLFVGQESGKLLAIRDIIRKGFTPPMLVFVQSKERAKDLFHELIYDGINVDVIHAERTQAQRDNVVKSFRAGKVWVLIATELMGRGIDFKGVSMVLNYDFPPSAVSYIHRIGRTGRAGLHGRAVTFFTEEDSVNLWSIAAVMRNSGCVVPDWMLRLKRPTKNVRRQLTQRALPRQPIKTVSKWDVHQSRRKREMVAASRHRKALGARPPAAEPSH